MINITPSIQVNEDEIEFKFSRSTGPGGQNVNKVASAVQLRLDVKGSPSIPEAVKQRLTILAGHRMTSEGILIIEARQYRTQEQNRQEAIERLQKLLYQASQEPKPRHKTRPSQAVRVRRLEAKRRRGIVKHMRRNVDFEG
jgi:ribosome-associated protein